MPLTWVNETMAHDFSDNGVLKRIPHVCCSGISPEEKRGGRGPWNWGSVEEAAR